VEPALTVLARLLYALDDEVLTDACWALSFLSDDPGPQNQTIQAVIQCGVARRLVELLMHSSQTVKTPALRTVANIAAGDDFQTQVILNCSVLPCLLALLCHSKMPIRKEACFTISNITAGNREQISWVIDANLVPALLSVLKNDGCDVQKEAAWVRQMRQIFLGVCSLDVELMCDLHCAAFLLRGHLQRGCEWHSYANSLPGR
jgi:importin subunit alpha-1